MSNAFADADLLAAASFDGRVSIPRALAEYRANRDGRVAAMYDFTVSLAALPRRSGLPLLLPALADPTWDGEIAVAEKGPVGLPIPGSCGGFRPAQAVVAMLLSHPEPKGQRGSLGAVPGGQEGFCG